MVSEHYASKYHGDFGPVGEDDIVRAPPPGNTPVRHAHGTYPDDPDHVEGSLILHEHVGGWEQHTH